MASIRKEILTTASPADAWAAIRDVGALHQRLVPGFVVDTRLEPGARIVTFANGMVVKDRRPRRRRAPPRLVGRRRTLDPP